MNTGNWVMEPCESGLGDYPSVWLHT